MSASVSPSVWPAQASVQKLEIVVGQVEEVATQFSSMGTTFMGMASLPHSSFGTAKACTDVLP